MEQNGAKNRLNNSNYFTRSCSIQTQWKKNFHCLFTRFACCRTILYTRDGMFACSEDKRQREREKRREEEGKREKLEKEADKPEDSTTR